MDGRSQHGPQNPPLHLPDPPVKRPFSLICGIHRKWYTGSSEGTGLDWLDELPGRKNITQVVVAAGRILPSPSVAVDGANMGGGLGQQFIGHCTQNVDNAECGSAPT